MWDILHLLIRMKIYKVCIGYILSTGLFSICSQTELKKFIGVIRGEHCAYIVTRGLHDRVTSFSFSLPLACLLLYSNTSMALEFSGFGTLGIGRVTTSEASVLDYDDQWSARSDTALGVQLSHGLTEKISVTTQVIAQDNNHNNTTDFEVEFEWFFFSYAFDNGAQFRIGRLRTPTFLYSDVLAVGYAQPWVRPPLNIYISNLTATTNFDGIDLSFSTEMFEHEFDITAYAGVMDDSISGLQVEADPIMGVRMAFLFDVFRLQYNIGFAKNSISDVGFNQLATQFELAGQMNPIFSELAGAHSIDDEAYQIHGLGLQADVEDWTFILEATTLRSNGSNVESRTSGVYFSVARQFEQWMPYSVFGYTDNLYNGKLFDLLEQSYAPFPAGIPAGFDSDLDILRGFASLTYNETRNTSYSWTLGCRYDFHPQAALKMEFQYFENPSLATPKALPTNTDSIVLSTVVLDFVF